MKAGVPEVRGSGGGYSGDGLGGRDEELEEEEAGLTGRWCGERQDGPMELPTTHPPIPSVL